MTRKRMSPEKVFAILNETLRVLKQGLLIADTLTDDELVELFELNHAFGQKLAELQSFCQQPAQEGRQ
jgi:hypothetical protein